MAAQSRTSAPALETRLASLESNVALLVASVDALLAYVQAPATAAPARGKTKTTARKAPVERATVCSCGAAYKRGRALADIAASPVGLCGLKGYSEHKQ